MQEDGKRKGNAEMQEGCRVKKSKEERGHEYVNAQDLSTDEDLGSLLESEKLDVGNDSAGGSPAYIETGDSEAEDFHVPHVEEELDVAIDHDYQNVFGNQLDFLYIQLEHLANSINELILLTELNIELGIINNSHEIESIIADVRGLLQLL